MQTIVNVWVGTRQCLVDINAKARGCWRGDKTVLNANAAFDQLVVKWGFNALTHQDVGDGCRILDVGGPLNGARIQVRCHLRVVNLSHRSNLFHLPDTACTAQCRLQDRGGPAAQNGGEFGLCGQSLTCRNRYAGAACHLGHLLHRVWWHRFFIPEWAIGFDGLGQPNGTRSGELTMGSK